MTKIGRNDPCPCGSGKKYKHCHLASGIYERSPEPEPVGEPASPLWLPPAASRLQPPSRADEAGLPTFPQADEPADEGLDEWDEEAEPDDAEIGDIPLEQLLPPRFLAAVQSAAPGTLGFSDALFAAFLAEELPADRDPETPLERATELVMRAYVADGEQRTALAREALACSPDCADAYLLLADEEVETAEAALPLYQQAVAAAERAVGDRIEAFRGAAWDAVVPRPLLRAKMGLALCLAELDREDEAVGIARELLELDPTDRQGIRGPLLSWLVHRGADEEAAALLPGLPPLQTTAAAFDRALLRYRLEGDTLFTRRALLAAEDVNPWGPDALLTEEPWLEAEPEASSPVTDLVTLAASYAARARSSWEATPGAIEWLAAALDAPDDLALIPPERRTGPRCTMTSAEIDDHLLCPECGGPTRYTAPDLAIAVEPDHLLAKRLPCRFCNDDDLLIVRYAAVERRIQRALDLPPDEYPDYLVLGVVAPTERGRRRIGGQLSTELADPETPIRFFAELADEEPDWLLGDLDDGDAPEEDRSWLVGPTGQPLR